MSWLARVLVALVALNAALLVVGALAFGGRGGGVGAGTRVGLVFDVGGKNDKSFNESAWRGLQAARVELGVQVQVIEPSDGADREGALRQLAAGGVDLVIAVGFIFGPDLERVAAQFPAVRFAGVDYAPTRPDVAPPPNLLLVEMPSREPEMPPL